MAKVKDAYATGVRLPRPALAKKATGGISANPRPEAAKIRLRARAAKGTWAEMATEIWTHATLGLEIGRQIPADFLHRQLL